MRAWGRLGARLCWRWREGRAQGGGGGQGEADFLHPAGVGAVHLLVYMRLDLHNISRVARHHPLPALDQAPAVHVPARPGVVRPPGARSQHPHPQLQQHHPARLAHLAVARGGAGHAGGGARARGAVRRADGGPRLVAAGHHLLPRQHGHAGPGAPRREVPRHVLAAPLPCHHRRLPRLRRLPRCERWRGMYAVTALLGSVWV
jgi:hypothetical protein